MRAIRTMGKARLMSDLLTETISEMVEPAVYAFPGHV
jgi:hypothetical protein